MHKATALAAAVLATCFAGCTAFPTASDYDLDWLAELAGQDEGPPVQLVAIWTDASLTKAGSPDTRGFGGRIYLYDSQQHPVEADGELIIYAFIEKDRQPPSKHPDRKFVFKAEELKEHYSRTALGHSYSIWLPWDRAGEEMVSVSLLPTFKPTDEKAKAVLGAPSLNVLKGKHEESTLEKMEVTTTSGVRPVSYITEEDGAGTGEVGGNESGERGSRRRVSIFDPQTNVVHGPLPEPATNVRGAAFEAELPHATGVSTSTFDLPSAMALKMKQAPPMTPTDRSAPPSRKGVTLSNRSGEESNEPANGAVFDLARIAAVAEASAKANEIAGAATAAQGSNPPNRFAGSDAGADEEELRVNRFNSRKRSAPSWERNRSQRW